jgi:phage-related tail protein
MSTTDKPKPPKRPLNAVFRYKGEKFEAYYKENPKKKLAEITSELCDQYKKLSEKEKQRYEEEYKKDLEKYKKVV